jgi:hypothetical protein
VVVANRVPEPSRQRRDDDRGIALHQLGAPAIRLDLFHVDVAHVDVGAPADFEGVDRHDFTHEVLLHVPSHPFHDGHDRDEKHHAHHDTGEREETLELLRA